MNKMLSKHFSAAELQCKHCSQLSVDMRLVAALEELRTIVGKPIKILSGYRCEEHNKAIGGEPRSLHTLGTAADIACPAGVPLAEFYLCVAQVPAFGDSGIGLYPGERTPFVHADVGRPKPARWARINGKYVGINEALKGVAKP